MSAWGKGPVWDDGFADPFVFVPPAESGAYRFYAYATNGRLGHVQVIASDDLRGWTEIGDGLPELPSWSESGRGRTWAPEVLALPDGRFAMYYTAYCVSSGRQAVGCALASAPEGPYADPAAEPLIDQPDEGGSIDASPYRDADGTAYLLWKNDGNAIGVDTWIYLREIDPADPARLVGETARLIKQDQPWEGDLVEGPFLWRRDGRYYLFYAANAFKKASYAEGYATGDSVHGPFTKAPENPILASRDDVVGPGHASMVEHEGRSWLAYHGWDPDAVGEPPGRKFWIDEVVWEEGRPVVVPGPQPGR